MRRREFLAGGLSAAIVTGCGSARELTSMRYTSYVESVSPVLTILGTQPATSDEVDAGNRILRRAAQEPSPLAIARYFEALPDRNGDGEPYNAEWRTRGNPVIVAFFAETQTLPAGDVTPWCAAFINWCLAAKGIAATHSAASASFRKFGREANPPQAGDIAVFKSTSDPGLGHVGFYIASDDSTVAVLGGNQRDHIYQATFAKLGSDLAYLGARAYG